jgi:MFS family permease
MIKTNSTSIYIIFAMNALLAVVTAVGMTVVPFLLVENLGISLLLLGIIEGLFEMSSSLIKLISGVVFDKIKNVKHLFWVSALLSLCAKLMLFSPTSLSIVLSKGLERLGNGMFATPRDAYILENSKDRGTTYGLLNASKTIGCVFGSILVSLLVYVSGSSLESNLNFILVVSCSVAIIAIIAGMCIENSDVKNRSEESNFSFSIAKKHLFSCLGDTKMQLKLLPIYLWAFIFFVGRFNDGMLMFYLKDLGYPSWLYLSSISIFNTTMFLVAPILGMLIDKKHTKLVLGITIFSLLLFNIVFIYLAQLPSFFAFIGLGLWGIQRTGAAIIFAYLLFQKSDDKKVYGTNLGILMFIMGIGSLFGSMIAGYLSTINFQYVFMFSATCATLSAFCSRFVR